jgi:hypothetical protein
MAQANSFSPIGISAVKTLARLAAKRAVQANLRDQGIRLTTYPYAEVMRLAAEYLANHPELYVAAHERAKRMMAEGVFGKRAQRAYLLTNAQSQNEPKSNTSTVQISGAEWVSK